uniref:Uncharacterized protein n=1 Tax=Leersia perrieri TaxID=77586 RepID=A0A0D9Y0U9_9ORYZ
MGSLHPNPPNGLAGAGPLPPEVKLTIVNRRRRGGSKPSLEEWKRRGRERGLESDRQREGSGAERPPAEPIPPRLQHAEADREHHTSSLVSGELKLLGLTARALCRRRMLVDTAMVLGAAKLLDERKEHIKILQELVDIQVKAF